MDCKAEPTFEGSNMVFEEVGIFVEVNGFEGEFAQSFATVSVGGGLRSNAAAAKFRAGAILVVHDESLIEYCARGC